MISNIFNLRDYKIKMLLPVSVVASLIAPAALANEQALSLRDAMRTSLERNFDVLLSATSVEDKQSGITRALGDFDYQVSGSLTREHSETPSSSSLDGVTSVVRSDSTLFKPTLTKKTRFGTELSLPYSYTISESNSSYNRLPIGHSTSGAIKIVQPILKSFAKGYFERNIYRAEQDLNSARAKHGEKLDDTALKAAELFLDALRDKETLRVQKIIYENAKNADEFVDAKRKVGKASLIEALESEAAYSKSQDSLLNAQATSESKVEELGAHVFGKLPVALKINPELGTLLDPPQKTNLPELTTLAVKLRPEVIAQKAATRKAEIELSAAATDLKPTVNLEGSYTHKGLAENFYASQDQINKGTYPSWSVGVKVERPLMRYASRSAIISKQLLLEQQKIKQAQLERDIDMEIKKSARDTNVNWERLQALSKSAEAQKQRLQAQTEKFKSGQVSVADLNKARADAETAEVDEIKARFALARSRLKLAASTGQLLQLVGIK